ncbi:hypothetical protein [Psychromicrobium lacuslunae]|uniref:hypothetical protein n=1 Tax=Psychromicrobium lacuslunae TaxID=1618207 RepID=UPI000AC8A253|nr:hypothetical protein [Psychromicrobium lacuslunae]
MKRRIFAVLATLALLVGVSGAIASPANAASSKCANTLVGTNNVLACSVWSNNYVQGRVDILVPPGVVIVPGNVPYVYYLNGAQLASGQVPFLFGNPGSYGPTIQVPHGSYFQAVFYMGNQKVYTPTIKVP